jgi:hypothetical protein
MLFKEIIDIYSENDTKPIHTKCSITDCQKTMIISLNSVNQLIFVMVKCGVVFEVRTEFLNNI